MSIWIGEDVAKPTRRPYDTGYDRAELREFVMDIINAWPRCYSRREIARYLGTRADNVEKWRRGHYAPSLDVACHIWRTPIKPSKKSRLAAIARRVRDVNALADEIDVGRRHVRQWMRDRPRIRAKYLDAMEAALSKK